MDMDKLKQWMDVAHRLDSGDFWKGIFEGNPGFLMPTGMPGMGTNVGQVQKPDKEEEPAAEKANRPAAFPAVDILRRGPENWVVIDLPGLCKHDVELTLSGGVLTVRGIAKPPLDNAEPLLNERFVGPFERAIPLPELGESSQLQARFEQGLLLIRYQRRWRLDESIRID